MSINTGNLAMIDPSRLAALEAAEVERNRLRAAVSAFADESNWQDKDIGDDTCYDEHWKSEHNYDPSVIATLALNPDTEFSVELELWRGSYFYSPYRVTLNGRRIASGNSIDHCNQIIDRLRGEVQRLLEKYQNQAVPATGGQGDG